MSQPPVTASTPPAGPPAPGVLTFAPTPAKRRTPPPRHLADLDPAQRKQQQVQFHKNMALIGGLAFALLDRSDRR